MVICMKCRLCDKEFKNSQGRNRTRCGSCNTKVRRMRNKAKAIAYLGGKCVRCGYDKHPAALAFHHRDPFQKEFTIGSVANRAWNVIVLELDKCDLLCANCHCIEHSDRTKEYFLKELGDVAQLVVAAD